MVDVPQFAAGDHIPAMPALQVVNRTDLHGKLAPVCLLGVIKQLGVRVAAGHRLFAIAVLARFHNGNGDRGVQIVVEQ